LECGLLELCQQSNTGVIVRTPLCFGFLTGHYAATKFDPSDHRSKWPEAQLKRWAEAYKVFAAGVQQTQAQTHAQIALRYCLSFPMISTAIPGMLNCGHVEENTLASRLGPLATPELSKIQSICREYSAAYGTPLKK
jgi:aryl-alcohol dehydrogenase-like predicted oxidoreductase